jgi:hypothetical protein
MIPNKLDDYDLIQIYNYISNGKTFDKKNNFFVWLINANYFISYNYPVDVYVKNIPAVIINIYDTRFGEPPCLRPWSLEEITLITTSKEFDEGQKWLIMSWVLQTNELLKGNTIVY